MEPRVTLSLRDPERIFNSGELLEFQCLVEADEAADIQAVEASVLWYSEGKGDEDMSVHYFLRRVPADVAGSDLRSLHEFRTHLPNSPLSYAGVIVKIHWCVRVRAFLRRGREISTEVPFTLGKIPAGVATESPQSLPPRRRTHDRASDDKKRERTAGGGF